MRVCPRCLNAKGPLVGIERDRRGNRVYLYAIHKVGNRYTSCYLGPEGEYVYVSRLHEREGLVLRNILDEGRALDYLERLVEYLEEKAEEGKIDIERLKRLVSRLAKLAEAQPPHPPKLGGNKE